MLNFVLDTTSIFLVCTENTLSFHKMTNFFLMDFATELYGAVFTDLNIIAQSGLSSPNNSIEGIHEFDMKRNENNVILIQRNATEK
jgi:hypothetical protein